MTTAKTMEEQRNLGMQSSHAYTCLLLKVPGDEWKVAVRYDDKQAALQWFDNQPKFARVYKKNGDLFCAK